MAETDNFIGTTFAGCRITAKIGQGGMGAVYTAHHAALDITVAVKLLSPELARERRNIEFFLREARSAAKLEHPNIVHIYDFGHENGSYFIVMSYIEGKSLADTIAEKGPMDPEAATAIILEVLDGLKHAHAKSIIHRDIKPANILSGPDGHPKIVDFGLARSISEEKQLTMAGEMVGTAYFMSPEQGLAGKVDHRADLYSVGATYFYLLTGKFPFEGKSSIEVIHKHIGAPFPNIILLKPDLPLWISRILEHLMRKKPDDRYQSAAQVIDEIVRLKTAEKDGTAVSNERSIELPELSARFAAEEASRPAAPPAPKQPAPPEAPLVSNRLMPAQPLRTARTDAARAKAFKDKIRLPAVRGAINSAAHASLSASAAACFLFAGSAGAPGRGPAESLFSPFTAAPYGAGFFIAAGLALMIWAVMIKPLKLTRMHAFFLAAAALAAYAGGIYIPSREAADMAAKAFFSLKLAAGNLAEPAGLPCYSLFLFFAASAFVVRPKLGTRLGALAVYGLSLLLTYFYFKGGNPVSPERFYLTLAGTAGLAGLAAALTQEQFTVVSSPALFFLASNALIFVMFTQPQIDFITGNLVNSDNLNVQKLRLEADRKYRQALQEREAAMPEFDTDGRPIEKEPVPKPAEILPTPREQLSGRARLDYYKTLTTRFRNDILDSGGLLVLSFFMLLMANIYFVLEVLACYGGHTAIHDGAVIINGGKE
ncbi:MAG: serine/threonine-protein kinase [Elusimicrobiales bacterium]|jgi:hypothetical protein